MKPRVLLENKQLEVTLTRLCYQLIEVHNDFSNTVIIGLQPRGIYLAHRIQKLLEGILKKKIDFSNNYFCFEILKLFSILSNIYIC